jgi:hypothetical protein
MSTRVEEQTELAVKIVGKAVAEAAMQVDYRILLALLSDRLGALAQAAIANNVMTVMDFFAYINNALDIAQTPPETKPVLLLTDGKTTGRAN